MLARDRLVEIEADAGAAAQGDITILNDVFLIGDNGGPVVAVEPVELDHQEVGDGGADLGGGHGADRRGDVVRRERDVVDLGQVGDLATLGQPAALGDI